MKDNINIINIECLNCKNTFPEYYNMEDGCSALPFCCSECYVEYHSIERKRERKLNEIINI